MEERREERIPQHIIHRYAGEMHLGIRVRIVQAAAVNTRSPAASHLREEPR